MFWFWKFTRSPPVFRGRRYLITLEMLNFLPVSDLMRCMNSDAEYGVGDKSSDYGLENRGTDYGLRGAVCSGVI